ncbi:MAG TPA: hypothetical protein EYM32_15450 [Dehalococcoidia bacterium]|nr:hypothetical protein [Dehalococcoidia bacterium]
MLFVGNECNESAELLPNLSKVERTRTIHWIDDEGGHRQGARAIFTIVGATESRLGPIARLFARWPLYALAEPWYRIFAHHRGRFSRFVGKWKCWPKRAYCGANTTLKNLGLGFKHVE